MERFWADYPLIEKPDRAFLPAGQVETDPPCYLLEKIEQLFKGSLILKTVEKMDKILILDFGSQVTQLIGRRLRELNVYCSIPWTDSLRYNKFYDKLHERR